MTPIIGFIIGLAVASIPISFLILTYRNESKFYKKLWENQFYFNNKLFKELLKYRERENWDE